MTRFGLVERNHGGTSRPSERDDFAATLRDAVAARGVSLQWLHDRLVDSGNPVSVATLSYWRSGRSQPEQVASRAALPVLEDLLRLPRGHLISRLGPSRRLGRHGSFVEPDLPMSDTTHAVLERVGLGDLSRTVESSSHVIMQVDAEGHETSISMRTVWKALVDGVDSVPSLLTVEEPGPGSPTVSAVSGCSITLQDNRSGSGVVASRLVLDHPLRAGELAMTEHRVDDLPRSNIDDCYYQHFVARRMTELVIGIRFHPDRLPVAIEAFTDTDAHPDEQVRSMPPSRSVNHVLRQFGPGRAGIRWFW